MSGTRRGFFSSIAGIGAGLDDPKAFMVFELPPGWDATDDAVDRITKCLEEKTGMKVLVVPPGVSTKLMTDGVYQREKLANYEYEMVAKTEEQLLHRMALCRVLVTDAPK